MHQQIQIDNEFKALIPPLQAEEYAQLEQNIIADGCRDPLVVWGSVLVDGHNRHEICTRRSIEFETVSIEFADRDDATEWIIKNQFGRRNLSDYQRGVLALRMKPIIEARAKENQGERTDIRPNSDEGKQEPIRTDSAVASLANLGKDTIRKIEHIEEVAAPEVKALAAAGDACHKPPHRFSFAIIADHVSPSDEDIDFANMTVRTIRQNGRWRTPLQKCLTLKSAVDRMRSFVENNHRKTAA